MIGSSELAISLIFFLFNSVLFELKLEQLEAFNSDCTVTSLIPSLKSNKSARVFLVHAAVSLWGIEAQIQKEMQARRNNKTENGTKSQVRKMFPQWPTKISLSGDKSQLENYVNLI